MTNVRTKAKYDEKRNKRKPNVYWYEMSTGMMVKEEQTYSQIEMVTTDEPKYQPEQITLDYFLLSEDPNLDSHGVVTSIPVACVPDRSWHAALVV